MLKPIIIPVLILAAFLSLIYGAYLPYVKASLYITALQGLQNVKTLDDFDTDFNQALQFYSPIGQFETVKFLLGNIVGIISQKGQSEAVARALTNYVEPYIDVSYTAEPLTMGQIYATLWMNYTHSDSDYAKAVAYYSDVLAQGPKLPPALYPLLQLYAAHNDAVDAIRTAETIHAYWPTDTQVSAFLNQFAPTIATSTRR